MPEFLTDIFTTNTDKSVDRLKDWGVDLTEEIRDVVNEVAKSSQYSYQSHVPINTGELRNTEIQIDFAKKNQKQLKAKIYVVDQIHINSRGRPLQASTLAILLNESAKYRRTKDSFATGGFDTVGAGEPTESWIQNAQRDIDTWVNRTEL